MKLTNTNIRHKRYSTYGWNVRNNDGSYINTLAQGEIGILLGSKVIEIIDGKEISRIESVENSNSGKTLNAVLEVRVGDKDNQYFFDALLIGKEGDVDHSIKQVAQLPEYGDPSIIYILKGNAYFWDVSKNEFSILNDNLQINEYKIRDIVKEEINFIDIIDGNKGKL